MAHGILDKSRTHWQVVQWVRSVMSLDLGVDLWRKKPSKDNDCEDRRESQARFQLRKYRVPE